MILRENIICQLCRTNQTDYEFHYMMQCTFQPAGIELSTIVVIQNDGTNYQINYNVSHKCNYDHVHGEPGSEANLTQQSVSIQSERVKPG